MIQKILQWIFQKYNGCFYIGKSDVLPPPLSKEEEFNCFVKAKQGDEASRNRLIEHNLRLVVFLAKKYESTGYDMEDLISIGSIGLIKGIETYKMDKNIKFATYASRCIANEILMYIRKNKKRKQEISLEDSLNYDNEGNELHLEDVLGTDSDLVSDEFEKSQERKYIAREINKLQGRERQIMILRYGLNNTESYTQKEVADMLGISQSYISRIEKKVIKNIRNLMKVV
ncbi:MAG: RNA polymerase sporulation sigma factor SigK [Bacilli bacterium]|nr:RNA polymerase sporulation sigma factor SigK [Bacilli bacterium]MBR1748177.1 RNA polymerase sporulation sigma factor SigK [Bacilli bacterium]MBR1817341.1 RNA polymerase sporulation sigma factor SigK [Bacilli bacterium]